MHSSDSVAFVLQLRAEGLGARRISARTGIAISTVSDWLRGRIPGVWRADPEDRCDHCSGHGHVFADLPEAYVYLLGLYLGDGYIAGHARGVFRLRIKLDIRYPAIVEECERAMAEIAPANRVGRVVEPGSWVEVGAYSRQWPCLFPQHGPGRKHHRPIVLVPW